MSVGRRWGVAPVAAAVGLVLLAGCSSGGAEKPDYQPSPGRQNVEGSPGIRIDPIMPTPSLSGPSQPGGGSGSGSGSGSAGPSTKPKTDPLVVATKLAAPVGLTMLPDNTALVGERTTGRIVRVQPKPGHPAKLVRTIPDLDTKGDGGLLDLALSPTYGEDSLIYAYITTAKDNRVVTFTLDGPVTPVITGIPKGRTGNTGRLQFTASGTLMIGTGDTGRSALAQKSGSLAGKILQINDIGQAASGNPKAGSPVYARGVRTADGLCALPQTNTVFELQPGAGGQARLSPVTKNGDLASVTPAATVPAKYGAPGDCTVLREQLWIASLDGKTLLSATLKSANGKLQIGKYVPALTNRYGRLRTIVAAKDGALWITTSNRDGKGSPVAADERVIRYVPGGGGGGGGSPV